MVLPRGIAHQEELVKEIDALLPIPGVVKWRYSIEDDWTGDPSIFFRITLSDEAARPGVLRENARRIRNLIEERIDPLRRWDLLCYENFRSESEQAELKDERFG
jgi:hypothetical protein